MKTMQYRNELHTIDPFAKMLGSSEGRWRCNYSTPFTFFARFLIYRAVSTLPKYGLDFSVQPLKASSSFE